MSANGIRNPLASILTYIAHNVGFRFHSCRGRKSRPKQTSLKLPQKRLSLWCARLTASLKFPRENSGIIRPTLLKSDTSILGAYADILPADFQLPVEHVQFRRHDIAAQHTEPALSHTPIYGYSL